MAGAQDIELEIVRTSAPHDLYAFRGGRQTYHLRVGPGRYRELSMDWDAALPLLRSLARSPEDGRLRRQVGQAVEAFLDPEGRSELLRRLARGAETQEGACLTVRLAAAELYALPWELLRLPGTEAPIAAHGGLRLRYTWPDSPAPPPPGRHGRRTLFAWSDAGGGVDEDRQRSALQQTEGAELRELERASLQDIERALRAAEDERRPITGLHLLCHGRPAEGSSGVVLRDPAGGADLVSAERLRAALAPFRETLRLVVLCVCRAGDGVGAGPYMSGIAQAVHQAGVEAVVASRFDLSHAAALALTWALYPLLAEGLPPDAALSRVRSSMASSASSEWLSFQLYQHPAQEPAPRRLQPARAAGAAVLALLLLAALGVLAQPWLERRRGERSQRALQAQVAAMRFPDGSLGVLFGPLEARAADGQLADAEADAAHILRSLRVSLEEELNLPENSGPREVVLREVSAEQLQAHARGRGLEAVNTEDGMKALGRELGARLVVWGEFIEGAGLKDAAALRMLPIQHELEGRELRTERFAFDQPRLSLFEYNAQEAMAQLLHFTVGYLLLVEADAADTQAFSRAAEMMAEALGGATGGAPGFAGDEAVKADVAGVSRPGVAGKNNAVVLLWRGNALLLAGDERGAYASYLEAFALDPRDPDLLNNMGLIELYQGRPRQASERLEQAWRVSGCAEQATAGCVGLAANLGAVALDLGELERAAAHLELARSLEAARVGEGGSSARLVSLHQELAFVGLEGPDAARDLDEVDERLVVAARALLDRLTDEPDAVLADLRSTQLRNEARVALLRGQHAEAIELLEQAEEALGGPGGEVPLESRRDLFKVLVLRAEAYDGLCGQGGAQGWTEAMDAAMQLVAALSVGPGGLPDPSKLTPLLDELPRERACDVAP